MLSKLPSGMTRAKIGGSENFFKERRPKIMTLIRYQAPELGPWSPANRWNNLRDELNSFFELPFWSGSARAGQLFTGWSPALDLYQSNDNVIAVVELSGMRNQDVGLSLHDRRLTIVCVGKRVCSSNSAEAEC